jgi:acylphosphatase
MADKLLYKIIVKGRVQGVGYRWSAANEAITIGITGIVKNQPDGSVYIEAEGSREQLELYADWCRRGPRMSRVDSVEINIFPPSGYDDFRIEH